MCNVVFNIGEMHVGFPAVVAAPQVAAASSADRVRALINKPCFAFQV